MLRFIAKHRLRISQLTILVALLAMGSALWPAVPRDVELEFRLGADHQAVRLIRVAYVQDGDATRGARFEFPDGAPKLLHHQVELTPGRYEVRVELTHSDGRLSQLTGRLEAPAKGVVRLRLSEDRS